MNKHQLLESWNPVIEATLGANVETTKKHFIATICQLQENYERKTSGSLNENNFYATLGSVNGMGAVSLPSTTGNGWSTGSTGSGDVPNSLLPLAIQVAQQTIAFDLVPTVPMNGPVGMLSYMDYVYGGGKDGYSLVNDLYPEGTNGVGINSPIYIKVPLDSYTLATKGASASVATIPVTVLGQSVIDGYAVLKLPRDLGGTSVAQMIPAGGPFPQLQFGGGSVANIIGKAELVRALEDHIVDFATNQGSDLDGIQAMSRLVGETTPANVGNIKLFSKSVEAKTISAAAAVTREQLMDLKQFGVDAVAQANQFLANEMTQVINKDILGEIFKLGLLNHKNIQTVSGKNYHLVLDNNSNTTPISQLALTNNSWGYFAGMGDVTVVDAINTGAENLATRQRRAMSRLLAGANIISVRGKRGPATFAVVSGGVASGLQDCAGFVSYPLANTMNQVPGALYPAGTIAGLSIYVDPGMSWDNVKVALGRKGDGNSPGLVFMPYVMADSVETIAEGTMGPKLQLKSRYALVHAGHHPETMYLTLGLENRVDNGWA